MQAPHSQSTRRAALCRLAALFVAAGALAACDKHSAQEVPESYGHGSAHEDSADQKSFTDHSVDSNVDPKAPRHYSDTQGTAAIPGDEPAATAAPSPAPAGTPAGHFF